ATVVSLPSASDWLVGGGEMGELIRSRDWSGSPLGSPERWPQSLRSAVSILLPSRAQICLFWGPQLVAIYNDAYRPTLGIKHPSALGMPAREVWSEFWDDVLRPLLEGVMATGEAFWAQDHPFWLERHGYAEETYFDISYDPVRDESGRVGGVFCIVSETTGRVIGERRLKTLRELGRRTMDARTVQAVYREAAAVLEASGKDVPFAILYEWDAKLGIGRLAAAAGIVPGQGAAPAEIGAQDTSAWPLGEASQRSELLVEGERLAALGPLPGGPWPEAVRRVLILPIALPAQPSMGFLVAGASPRLELDDGYRDYLRLVASAISSAIGHALALETEKKRVDALAQLDRAKTAFFSNVSHEFRTPITLLLGPIEEELAQGERLTDESRLRLETAHRNGVRLLKLVNTLLDFSRIEAGRMRAHFEPADLSALTAELASNFRSACVKAGLSLVVRCSPLPDVVHVDRDMWEKVVLNLVSNAFKFTLAGEIEVSTSVVDGRPCLEVRDTGIGIPPEELPRVFERFHRVEGARGRTHEGSGIGLALVQELVRMHGGEIRVESEAGRGSTFVVTLRFGTEHLRREAAPTGGARAGNPGTAAAFVEEAMAWLGGDPGPALDAPLLDGIAGLEPERILVVDDNADMREYIARLLAPRWHVETASGGASALARLRSEPFDLVITDVMMPEVDGLQLVREVRSDPALAALPVLMLSARAGEESRIEGLEAGADDYLVKPFGARELVAQVRSQLTILRARKAAAREREALLENERVARQEAQLQREHLYSLFMQAPNPMAILRGPAFLVDLANPPICEVWGRRHEQVIGRPLLDALPELDEQVYPGLLRGVLATGVAYVGKEARFVRHAGPEAETRYLNFVYSPLRGVDGTIEGILVVAFEVTDEVRARRQLDELRAQAEDANRTKDQFLAMLGHELRNPLSPIVSALHLLRMRGFKGTEIDILERQARHLTRMVDDLLDVSRITRGKIDLRMHPMELSAVVDKAVETVQPMVESAGDAVEIDVPREGLCVDVDPERMAQAIGNLLANAVKYSEAGSPIRIRARTEGGRVRLAVIDRGMGIAPEMIERVFDLFVQQTQTLARSAGGLGLGLAIVRNIVEMHGGSVTARSDGPGCGSEFGIELPLATARPELLPAPGSSRGAPVPAATPRRILVVDDNVDAAATLGAALRMQGHTVETVHTGLGAMAAAESFEADVALIDIGLPDFSGYELAQRLRALRGADAPRLVAVTGYGLEADRTRARDAGFDRHFVKPLDFAQLEALLAGLEAPGEEP
ncbi:MAG TPA: ATP-binding protein, partial [Usitatibacter sp.]|nr:ATP-binding protein [Usitatibacter sp.]